MPGLNYHYFISVEVPFRLNSIYGNVYELTTTRTLDRESRSEYAVIVACLDAGTPRNRAEVRLPIKVHDVNDNPPALGHNVPATLRVHENTPPESAPPLYRFNVTDADRPPGGGGVDSGVTLEVNDTRFSVGRDGTLYASVSFDRELTARVALTVTARDSGQPPLTTTAQIVVLVADEDDEIPMFSTDVYRFRAEEMRPGHVVIGRVTVTDADTAKYRNPYSLACDTSENFRVDVAGVVTAIKPLKYEEGATRVYQFGCRAEFAWNGRRMTSRCKVEVEVTDVNEHAPVFVRFARGGDVGNVTVYVNAGQEAGVALAEFPATDSDRGRNARLTYRLIRFNGVTSSASTLSPVFLDAETGVLRLREAWMGGAWVDGGVGSTRPSPSLYCVNVSDGASPSHRRLWAALYFVLVYNHTSVADGPPFSGQSTLAKTNYTVVVVILSVSGVVSLILVAAIAFVLHRKRVDRQWMRTYKS